MIKFRADSSKFLGNNEPFSVYMWMRLTPEQAEEFARVGKELHRLREEEYNEYLARVKHTKSIN